MSLYFKNITLTILVLQVANYAIAFGQPISYKCQDKPFRLVLEEITHTYSIKFSYSPDFVSLNEKVTIDFRNGTVEEFLGKLYPQTGLLFSKIGSQFVLKSDPDWKRPVPVDYGVKEKQSGKQQRVKIPAETLEVLKIGEVKSQTPVGNLRAPDPELQFMLRNFERPKDELTDGDPAQMSIFPFVGTTTGNKNAESYNLSVNVVWGVTRSVEGVEIGGIANTVTHTMNGFQFAGGINTVGQKLNGTQFSGIMNLCIGEANATQLSGVVNVTAGSTRGIQGAGTGNITVEEFHGLQGAGLFNIIGGNAGKSVQMAGALNVVDEGTVGLQVSGLINVANEVEFGQIGGLVNVAKKVNGFQVGFINIADTVSGVPIGFLNIMKNGYNRIELGVDEGLSAHIGYKTGNHHFYNIFQGGLNIREKHWSLGYGFGFAPRIAREWLLNTEFIASHVNANNTWTNRLNLRSQLRLTADFSPVGIRSSFYFGPVLNVFTTQRKDEEGRPIGFSSIHHTFFTEVSHNTLVQMWIGFQGGWRF